MDEYREDAYKDFAYVYDELMDNTPYEEWCERIAALIKQFGVSKPKTEAALSVVYEETQAARKAAEQNEAAEQTEAAEQNEAAEQTAAAEKLRQDADEMEEAGALASERDLVLDLGCGTGTLTHLLCEKGYDMIGVDKSEEMLSVALEKREESGDQILYLLQDMRELELYSTVGTVISVCDSLNYILEEEELAGVFELVNNYLYPGGIFIFDFNTVYKYEQVIGDATIAENREDCSFIWENYYYPEEQINEYDLTVFVQEEGDTFRRFTETHYQRGYTVEQMKRLVQEAGMKVLLVKDSDTDGPVTETTQRVYMVAGEQEKGR